MSDLRRGAATGFLNTFSKNLPQGRLDATGRAYQKLRDFVVDRFLPRPEALFTKVMTGGAPTQTEMTPTELGKIKDAYQTQKQFPQLTDEELLAKLQKTYKKYVPTVGPEGSPYKFPPPPTIEDAQKINAEATARKKDPVVSLYEHGRDVRMSYGGLSVFPQPDGGVRIYDRWKVDKNLYGTKDSVDRIADLGEGGPIPSLIYSAAKNIGTYKPVDIDVTIPGEEWRKIKPIPPENRGSFDYEKEARENQGVFLNTLNKLYQKLRPGPKVPAFVAGPEKMGPASFFTGDEDNFKKDFAVDFTKQFKPLYKGTASGN